MDLAAYRVRSRRCKGVRGGGEEKDEKGEFWDTVLKNLARDVDGVGEDCNSRRSGLTFWLERGEDGAAEKPEGAGATGVKSDGAMGVKSADEASALTVVAGVFSGSKSLALGAAASASAAAACEA